MPLGVPVSDMDSMSVWGDMLAVLAACCINKEPKQFDRGLPACLPSLHEEKGLRFSSPVRDPVYSPRNHIKEGIVWARRCIIRSACVVEIIIPVSLRAT